MTDILAPSSLRQSTSQRYSGTYARTFNALALWGDVMFALSGGSKFKDSIDCSLSPNYPAGSAGDWYYVSVAGFIGGGAGKAVEVGDTITCIADNDGGTEAVVGTSWYVSQVNMIPTTVAVLRTGTNNTDFVSAKTLKDQGITTAAATIIALAGGTTQQLLLTATAAQKGMTITQTAGTQSALKITSIINSTTVNIVDITGYTSTALAGSSILTGNSTAMGTDSDDADGATVIGFRSKIISSLLGRADLIGYSVELYGNRGTADTTQGLLIDFGKDLVAYTQTSASSQSYGLRIAALQGKYVQTDGQFYGVYVNADALYVQSATCTRTGFYLGGTFDRGIDFKSVTLKAGQENAMIDIGTWATPITISSQTEHFVPIQVNLASNTSIAKNISAARFRVDTAVDNSLTAVYAMQMRNSIQHNVASAYTCHASMNVGTMAVITGSMAVSSFYLEGTGTITHAGSNPIDVTNITNVHSGTGVSNCLNVCNNTASAVGTVATLSNLAGVVTDMLYINNANTATSAIHLTAGTLTNVINVAGAATTSCMILVNAATASTCVAPNTSAINALTAKIAVKVMVGGSVYWIPAFSCTNGTGATFN